MKKIRYILIVLIFYSCSAVKIEPSFVVGKYYKRQMSKNTFSINYNLILKSDNTFSLSMNMQDANPKCNGKWELRENKYIYLKCDETNDIGVILSSGYMNEKEYKLEIINRNKIKFKNVILKKQ